MTMTKTEAEIAAAIAQWRNGDGMTDTEIILWALANATPLLDALDAADAEVDRLRRERDEWKEQAHILRDKLQHTEEVLGKVAGHDDGLVTANVALATENATLRALVGEAADVIQPFSDAGGQIPIGHGPYSEPVSDDEPVSMSCVGFQIGDVTAGHMEAARALLTRLRAKGGE